MAGDGLNAIEGRVIRLEPLRRDHAFALAAASSGNPELYRWSPVPQTLADVERYIETAISWRDAGTAEPFAIVRCEDGAAVGSTRFWNIERWAWPAEHERNGKGWVDGCEIGHTWLTGSAVRTGVNTEAKFLMLEHAFETWRALRVCFHTDSRNERSRAALARIGAKYEGILRSHRMAADFIPRDSVRFSIVAAEWSEVKARLSSLRESSPRGR